MGGSGWSRRYSLVRRVAFAAFILTVVCSPGPRRGLRAATLVPNDFFVARFGGAVVRFDTSGTANPLPGGNVFLPDASINVTWGPDYKLYRVNPSGGVDSFDPDTGTITPFIAHLIAPAGNGMAFGPDGNLFVGTSKGIERYCGPATLLCPPGAPAGLTGVNAQDAAMYSPSITGSDIVFGPDGNLYDAGGRTVFRVCGPKNPACLAGQNLGLNPATDSVTLTPMISLPTGFLEGIAFGADGNLYLTHQGVAGNVPVADILRFCGGAENGSNCPLAKPAPDLLKADAVFYAFPAPIFTDGGLDFAPNGELYVIAGGAIQRLSITNCSSGLCQGAPHPNTGQTGSTLVPSNALGISLPRYLRFPHPITLSTAPPPRPVLLLSKPDAHRVLRFDAATGAPLPAGTNQSGADFIAVTQGIEYALRALTIGPDGNLYAVDVERGALVRFNGQTGEPMPAPGREDAEFLPPFFDAESVAFDAAGRLYVGEVDGVWCYDAVTATLVQAPGQIGAEFIALDQTPYALAFGPDGSLWVGGDREVGRYDGQTGAKIGVIDQGGRPHLVFGPDGNLYVAQLDRVLRYDGRTGAALPAPGQSGGALFIQTPWRQFEPPLAFGPDGYIYMAGDEVGEVQRFDPSTGIVLDTFIAGDRDTGRASWLTFSAAKSAQVTGSVFRDEVGQSHAVPFAQVQAAAELVPGLFTCPLWGFIFEPCPSTTTDSRGQYVLGLVPQHYELTAWPPAGLDYFPNRILVTVQTAGQQVTGPDIVLVPSVPLPPGVSVTPSRLVPAGGGSVPVVGSNDTFIISIAACTGATGSYEITDSTRRSLVSGTLTEVPPAHDAPNQFESRYVGMVEPLTPFKGAATVTITMNCPGGSSQPSSFLIYIDPSGRVIDDVTGQPIAGATVTLFRADTTAGPFTQVPQGSAVMALSNRNNPDQTSAAGAYGWDVAPGYYRLQAFALGYTCDAGHPPQGFTCVNGVLESGAMAIPPAVTDLDLPLHSLDNMPPSLTLPGNTTLEATGPAGAVATFTASAVDGVDGTVPLNCSVTSPAALSIGMTTVTCSATDAHHNTATGSFTITVVDTTAPLLSLPAGLTLTATSAQGAIASIDATAVDLVDGSVPVTCTPASGSLFAIGTTTVTCTAVDHAGNKSSGTLSVTVGSTPDGRMSGALFIGDGRLHQHVVFRVSQARGVDGGRFEYWANEARRCRSDDDFEPHGATDRFEATAITAVTFSDDPAFTPGRGYRGPRPTIDTVRFAGVGKWNGRSGYTFEAFATDQGEPGRHRDTFSLVVKDAKGNVVATVSGAIDGGNIQSTRLSR